MVSRRVAGSPFGSVRASGGVGERLEAQHVAGFAGLEVEVFLGIHVQSDLVAGAEDPGLGGWWQSNTVVKGLKKQTFSFC